MESSSRQAGGGVRWKWRPAEWLENVVPQCSGEDCPRRSRLRTTFSGRIGGHSFESRWYCSAACLQSILRLRLHSLLSGLAFDRARVHRFPIGLLLLNRGSISHHQLRDALSQQREAGEGRLGDWLCRLNFITEQQLTAVLA